MIVIKKLFIDEKILKWLFDIKASIQEIEGYFDGKTMDFDSYKSKTILKRAVERNLEIIGEAINRILKQESEFPLENAKRIIGLRNQIIHAYDSISDENIWAIITKHLPILKGEILALIQKENLK